MGTKSGYTFRKYVISLMFLLIISEAYSQEIENEELENTIVSYHLLNTVGELADGFFDIPVEMTHYWGHTGVFISFEAERSTPWQDGDHASLLASSCGVALKWNKNTISGPSVRMNGGISLLLPDNDQTMEYSCFFMEAAGEYVFGPALLPGLKVKTTISPQFGLRITSNMVSGEVDYEPFLGLPIGFVF